MNSEDIPFFSIIIPCYNQAHYLPDCLNSILDQNYQEWEAIVVNDGSTDDTSEVTRAYISKDNRIKLIEKVNGGLSSARNAGIRASAGERYIFLDADDFLKENCLEAIREVLHQTDDYTLIQYGYTYITDDKNRILHSITPPQRESFFPSIFQGSPGPCHTICISKSLINAVGWFDENLRSVEDWDFWTRAIKCGAKQKVIGETLVFYRIVKDSMSRNAFVMFEALKEVIRRAPLKDNRININSPLNRDYEFDNRPVLQAVLIRSLGVSIMQGKIDQSCELLIKESFMPIQGIKPESYGDMCSYLSFRYRYEKDEIKNIFDNIYPHFDQFFIKLRYSSRYREKALYSIFKFHLYHRNLHQYGKILGGILNFMLKRKYP